MKIIKTASGNEIKISKSEWQSIGKTAGWAEETDSRHSMFDIFRAQSKMFMDEDAQTMLDDFIYKADRIGYSKDEVVEGLSEFYRQHESSGTGIYDRAMARKESKSTDKTASVIKEAMTMDDLQEGVRFRDPRNDQEGALVTRKYHQDTLWMMLWDEGTIEELTNSDLSRIEKI